jgi:hypothetical protein
MRHDEYCRLHEACLAMAKQVTEQKIQDRWLAMADAWLKRSMELSARRRVVSMGLGHAGPQSTGAPDQDKRPVS